MCLPTPFDFNDLLVVVALSRQWPPVRVASSERQDANHLKSVLWFYMHLQGLSLLTVLG
jgi:hypothetical protein